MTPARHSLWAHALFRRYTAYLLQRGFGGLYLLGRDPVTDPDYPILLVPNHSSWWDGFFVYQLNRVLLRRRFHIMMLESQLTRYPFFSRVGAFGIEPGQRREVLASIRYAASLLGHPSNLLCLFPQGELKPNGRRPLGFERGLLRILERLQTSVTLLPLAIRAELLIGQRPDVFFRFGDSRVVSASTSTLVSRLEEEVTRLLDEIASDVSDGQTGRRLVRGRPGVQQRWDDLHGR